MVVHARFQGLFSVPFEGVGGEGDNRDMLTCAVFGFF